MQIIHISDTHGKFPPLPDLDVPVFHTGDFFPNKTRGDLEVEPGFQASWLYIHLEEFKSWLQGREFVYVSGNHDFMPSQEMSDFLNRNGVNMTDTTGKLVDFQGYKLFGIPWIPWIRGEWNWERIPHPPGGDLGKKRVSMEEEFKSSKAELLEAQILLAHCPCSMVLDNDRGNVALYNFLFMNEDPHKVKAVLSGHNHEGFGTETLDGIRFYHSTALDRWNGIKPPGFQIVDLV